MSQLQAENINVRSNYLKIKSSDGAHVELHINALHGNVEEPLQVHVVGYEDELSFYDELTVEESRQVRNFMNKAYPLSLKDILSVAVWSLKSLVYKKD